MAEAPEHLVVVGGGPGGYAAAFRAADLGLKVTLIERYPTLGGVCLNVGCIPSKALLHTASIIREATALKDCGVVFEAPKIAPEQLAEFNNKTIAHLNQGLFNLAKQRDVELIQGSAYFNSEHTMQIKESEQTIQFDKAIIATGSRNHRLPNIPEDARILDSTSALNFRKIPARLLVIGGGVIGIETAFIYQGLGSEVSLLEIKERLLDSCDADIVQSLYKHLKTICKAIYLSSRVQNISADNTLNVTIQTGPEIITEQFDAILVSAGRLANSDHLGLEALGIICDRHGFIQTDSCLRTNLPHIYAVGDVSGAPLLAHKASYQGKVAAQHAAGLRARFDVRAIPFVVYSDPEIAWTGLSEQQAQRDGIAYQKATFPWQASGRALTARQEHGLTKVLYDARSKKLLGAAICGAHAGELIGELVLALEMGADIEDVALSMHPHPTYSETVGQASELALGTIVELYSGEHKGSKSAK